MILTSDSLVITNHLLLVQFILKHNIPINIQRQWVVSDKLAAGASPCDFSSEPHGRPIGRKSSLNPTIVNRSSTLNLTPGTDIAVHRALSIPPEFLRGDMTYKT